MKMIQWEMIEKGRGCSDRLLPLIFVRMLFYFVVTAGI